MKKISIFLAVIILVLVTGCGKKSKLTCTTVQKFTTVDLNTEIVITFEGGYASKTKTIMKGSFTSEDLAKSFAHKYGNAEEYKIKVDGEKIELTREDKVDKKNLKQENNKKAKVKEYMESKGYSCK